jgi:23S rRNA (guanine745-N1)-methyltransferase
MTNEWGAFFVSKNNMINAHLIMEHESIFRCPICSSPMKMVDRKSLLCSNNHCFDLSKQGYLNLFPHAFHTKYDKHMFDSRRVICQSGFFEPLRAKMSEKMMRVKGERINILDAGCGEGSHLASLSGTIGRNTGADVLGVGVDLSKEGIYFASKEYPKMIWCVADLAKCPFARNQFNIILNILSPSNYAEFRRMIKDEGMVIKVIPGWDYLQELRAVFYEQTKKQSYSNNQTLDRFRGHFELIDMERVQYRFSLDYTLIKPLIQMTPLSWGTTEERLEKVIAMNLSEVTVDLTILLGKLM